LLHSVIFSDFRVYDFYQNRLNDFREAISLMKISGENFSLPIADFKIPGYFFKSKSCQTTNFPIIIAFNGYDGFQEGAFRMMGTQALARGYNYVTLRGLGIPSFADDKGQVLFPNG
jgi:hypothetical protein